MSSDLSSNPTAPAAAGSPAPGGPNASISLNPAPQPAKPKSAWSPLAVPIFRALWIAYLVSLIGTWAREAGGPKLMENLTSARKDSPLWVSLVQTAGTLPICLLSIIAGVLADTLDRRKLLLWCNIWMLVISGLLAAVTFAGQGFITKESLLVLTLLLGIGAAMAGPAFQYVIPELVPPADLPLAVSLNSVSLNIARAVGPALAGALIAFASMWLSPIRATGTSFVLNAVAFIGVVWVLARWDRAPQKAPAHRETMWGAIRTAVTYTAHSPALRAILIRVAAFITCAVIVWAQLIIIAKKQLAAGDPARGENLYYILMACVGAGAVVGVVAMPKMDKRFSTEGMVAICTAIFGVALIGLSQCTGRFANIYLAGILAMVIGFNWVIVPTNFNIATQRSVPGWVKGRAIAMYMTVLFGSFAIGSPIWGRVATVMGISAASLIAGCLILAGLLLVRIFPLTRAVGQDFALANHPAPTDAPPGPANLEMVLAYRIARERTEEFATIMQRSVRPQRLRNGATRWNLAARDDADEASNGSVIYEERFTFTSWSDRLRFHARTTKADVAAEEAAMGFVVGPKPAPTYRALAVASPSVSHQRPISSRHMPSPPPLVDWDYLATRFLEELGTIINRAMGERPERRNWHERRGGGRLKGVGISLNITFVKRFFYALLAVALLCSLCTPPRPSAHLTPRATKPMVAQWTPRPYPTDQVNLIAMGDWGSGGQEQKDVAWALAKYVGDTGTQFNGLLTLGDNFYVPLKDVDDYQFQSLFEDMFDARRLNFPFYVTLGNHDYEKEKAKIELAYAAKHPDSRWKFPSQWYRLDLPAEKPLVTILMLNSNKPRLTPEQWDAQIQWIDEQLSQPRSTKWTIACAHHPLFSNGAHGDNGVLQVQWGPIFKKHKLDFYFCGHDHDMQQLQVPNWSTTFVLAGGGGKKPTKMRRDIRGPFSKSMNGFSHLQLFEDRAIVHFVSGEDARIVHEIQRTPDGQVSMLVKGKSDKATTQPLKVLLGIDLDEKKEAAKDPAKAPASGVED